MSRDEFHAILRLRIDIFVVEQNCPYPELDGKDLTSIHVYAFKSDDTELFMVGDATDKVYKYLASQTAFVTTVKAGQAISATTINMKDLT